MTIRPARGTIMPVSYVEDDFMASIEKLPAGEFNISRWSGGTTTELFIWPHGASYAERRFGIRISTATVDIAQSTFTKLPRRNALYRPAWRWLYAQNRPK